MAMMKRKKRLVTHRNGLRRATVSAWTELTILSYISWSSIETTGRMLWLKSGISHWADNSHALREPTHTHTLISILVTRICDNCAMKLLFNTNPSFSSWGSTVHIGSPFAQVGTACYSDRLPVFHKFGETTVCCSTTSTSASRC
jgi:hypothetical protein